MMVAGLFALMLPASVNKKSSNHTHTAPKKQISNVISLAIAM